MKQMIKRQGKMINLIKLNLMKQMIKRQGKMMNNIKIKKLKICPKK